MIIFETEGHKYTSILPDGIEWVSVSTLISQFKEPFDPIAMSIKCSKNKKSKWFGMKPEEIRWVWKNKADRSCDLGTKYHAVQEAELLSCDTIEMNGHELKVQAPIVRDGIKVAPEQKLENDCIYPEHMVFFKTMGVCGQVDRPEVIDNLLNVTDYKTNEEIKKESYYNPYTCKHKMMLNPLAHLQDCNFVHYELQLSCYVYMMLKHNPNLSVGKLIVEHAVFDTEGEDQYGDPIVKIDNWGNPVVKDIIPEESRYLKQEVESMFGWLKDNRCNLRSKS